MHNANANIAMTLRNVHAPEIAANTNAATIAIKMGTINASTEIILNTPTDAMRMRQPVAQMQA